VLRVSRLGVIIGFLFVCYVLFAVKCFSPRVRDSA
jgi:hypothetical protein